MFENISRLYNEDKLNIRGLEKAVKKGWITEDEKEKMIKEKGDEYVQH